MRFDADAILFDSDGVLVDSHAQVEVAWTQLTNEFDIDTDEVLEALVGVRAADTLARFLPAGAVAAAVARLEDLEVETAATTPALRGALELIQRLPPDRWAIATSASRRLGVARWQGAGIPIPPETITAEDVSAGKPDPEPFLAAADALGVDPGRCIVFEDSSPGGAAGRAAGATVIAVGHHPWSTEPAARVDDLRQIRVEVNDPRGPITVHVDRN